ncbi:MFS transporter [Aeromicrobium camelliae]|uniref:MFS transporter n=1 Tax=Aeromicrobium camelliae TaxID=1538144 RepID=A0A3N6WRH9_9ACTN|nr:MFS transporter [Aeromicrobium camelliae]RQN10076.1 MFS transporter [Aeromicrobium camelliae]
MTSAQGHRPGSAAYRRLNWAMLMAGIAAFGMLYSTQPLLPQIGDAFAVSPSSAALTVSAGTGGLAITVVLATWIGERVGRARVMRLGLVVAVVAQLVSTAMPTFELLIAARVVLGLALAGLVGVAMGHVGAEVHPAGLGQAMGLYVAGNSIGGVLGRLVTAGVSEFASWRLADAALGMCAAAATVAFIVLLPASDQVPRRHLPPQPRPDRAAWLRPQVWALALVPFLLMGGFVALYNYLTYRLVGPPFSLSPAVVGLVFLAYLAGSVTSAVAGHAADRIGRVRAITACLALMALGIVATLPDALWLVVLGLVVLTAGFFGAHAVASGWMPLVGRGLGPLASGVYVSAYYAGSSVLGAAVGIAWTHGGWSATAGTVLGLTALAGVCVVVVAARRIDP